MTIITKPLTGKKKSTLDKPLVAQENAQTERTLHISEDPNFVIPGRRVSSATILCLFLTSLTVLGTGIVGGLYLYKQWSRTTGRYYGRIEMPLDSFMSSDESMQDRLYADRTDYNAKRLSEDLELDLEHESYEKIDVPTFSGGRRGRFIHDFNSNKTGIVDVDGGRCFIMPLNRDRVLPPRNLFDLINKMLRNYYDVNSELIRESYRVEVPPLANLKEAGVIISRECDGLPTYRLIPVSSLGEAKRSVPETEYFTVFDGKKIISFDIIMDDLAAYEHDH